MMKGSASLKTLSKVIDVESDACMCLNLNTFTIVGIIVYLK